MRLHLRRAMLKYLPHCYSLSYAGELEKAVGLNCKTILDVGCGSNSPMKAFSGKFYLVGTDAHKPSLEESRKKGIHNEYYCMTFSELDKLECYAFDCVVALDVIEHLKKGEGLQFLDNIERIAKKKIIVYTPNGFVPQEEFSNNPWQVHRSGWTVKEMRLRGYKVVGIGGLKSLRGERAAIRFNPKPLWETVSLLSQYIVADYSELAYAILCIKIKE